MRLALGREAFVSDDVLLQVIPTTSCTIIQAVIEVQGTGQHTLADFGRVSFASGIHNERDDCYHA